MQMSVTEARTLAQSWHLHLRAERKSEQTLKSYGDGVRFFLDYCEANAADPLDRAALNLWVTGMLDDGRKASTARSRQLAVRRFTSWLADEDEIAADPFDRVKPPQLDDPIIEPLSDAQLSAMLKACKPASDATPQQRLRHVRDEAIIRLMLESTLRAGELIALDVDDLDLAKGEAIVRRGKGGKGRRVAFGQEAARAIDRYMRLRRHHRLADTQWLWLGDRGKRFSYDALHKSLAQRAAAAGIDGFHPHRLRHTAAHRWLAKGGSEMGLMAMAGWSRPDMLMRYTKARAADRAIEEARTLGLGDDL